MLAALPFAADHLPALPPGVDIVGFEAHRERELPLSDLEFFVPAYGFQRLGMQVAVDMPKLRAVQLLTAGYENALPLRNDGVTLCNATGVHDAATAEHAVGLMIASQRRYPELVRAQDEGRWDQRESRALADSRVLIVGSGAIGRAIERRLTGFECEVTLVASRARDGVHGVDELPALLPAADVVVLILPLNEATTHLFDRDMLARMRDGTLLVNVARGGIVDTGALLAELESGRLRASLDVYEEEPLPADHPLWRAPGAFVAPHVGGPAESMWPRAYALVADQMERLAAGRELRNVVAGPAAP